MDRGHLAGERLGGDAFRVGLEWGKGRLKRVRLGESIRDLVTMAAGGISCPDTRREVGMRSHVPKCEGPPPQGRATGDAENDGHPGCRWPCACRGRARDWYQLRGEMAQACLSLEYSDCTRKRWPSTGNVGSEK